MVTLAWLSVMYQIKTVSLGYLFQSGLKRMVKMISSGTMRLVLTTVTTRVNVSLTDHKNERGLYNVHLYYVETNGKLVGVGGTTYTVPAKVEETHTTTSYSLPDAGTYTFKERSSIKAEPRVASPELAYYDAGMSVNYDKIVSGDGYQWLSYLSYNGNRRYVAVSKLAQQESKPSGTINIENLSNLGFDVPYH